MANRLQRAPHWLRRALQLQDIEVPESLDIDSVIPVVDVFQHGHGIATWRRVGVTIAQNTPAGNPQLVAASDTETRLILAFDCQHVGGAAPARIEPELRDVIIGNAVRLATRDVAVGDRDGHVDFFGGLGHIIVPVGLAFGFQHTATGAGESLVAGAIVGTVPAGFDFR